MTSRELAAVVRLGAVAATAITTRVQEVHHAVTSRVFTATGRATGVAGAAQELHDAVAATVYGQVRLGLRAGSLLAGVAGAAARSRPPAPGELSDVPASLTDRTTLGAAMALVNGWTGDRLHASGDILATRMTIRMQGRPVPAERDRLAAAFPEATGRVVLFLHGLVNTEQSWQPRGEGRRSFGDQLADDRGATPVFIRYNTGLHISENGALLSDLVQRLVDAWPVAVTDLVLIGHSMGGLVARSALHQALEQAAPWAQVLRATISLGSPHLGAPLERAVNEVEHGLRRWPESAPFATLLTGRSSGIKDLRFGNLVTADWEGFDPAHRTNERTHVPLAAGSRHFLIYSTVSQDGESVVGRILGDVMVRPFSATGRGRRHPAWELPVGHIRHLGGLHHLQLLTHPRVYEQLRTWVGDVLS